MKHGYGIRFGKFSSREILVYSTIGFIITAFWGGPFLSYMYSIGFAREGADRLWFHGFIVTVPALISTGILIRQHRKYWKNVFVICFSQYVFSRMVITPSL